MTKRNQQDVRVTSLIWEIINGHGNEVETGSIADEVLDRIWKLYDAGEHWVEWWLKAYAREGIRRRVCAEVKSSSGIVRLSGTGKVIELPTHVGVKTKENGRTVYQLKLWHELEWPVFLEMVSRRVHQRRVLTNEVRAFNEITALRQRFPASKTPGEACEMAGIDPTSFALEEPLAI